MGIKLDRCKRWLPAKNYLKDQHDISVPFSNLHYNYYSAWEYVTKEDDRSYKAKIIPIYGIPNLLAKTNVVSSLLLFDIVEFIVNRGPRVVAEVLTAA